MKKYNSLEIEIMDACDVVSTSAGVETGRIPLDLGQPDESSYET